jgi:hypothetical protein
MPANLERIAAGWGASGAQNLYMTGTMQLTNHPRDSGSQALD